MRQLSLLFGALAAGAVLAGPAAPAAAQVPARAPDVTFEQSRLSATIGDRFTLVSRVTNPDPAATSAGIANLNVVSLTSDVYVDPEDWSPDRVIELGALDAAASEPVTWEIQAVNAGRFAIYVVLLPETGEPVVSPPVYLTVAGRRTLSAGGALPIALTIPILLGLAAAAARYRLRRTA
jgi:hypothetical protein